MYNFKNNFNKKIIPVSFIVTLLVTTKLLVTLKLTITFLTITAEDMKILNLTRKLFKNIKQLPMIVSALLKGNCAVNFYNFSI